MAFKKKTNASAAPVYKPVTSSGVLLATREALLTRNAQAVSDIEHHDKMAHDARCERDNTERQVNAVQDALDILEDAGVTL